MWIENGHCALAWISTQYAKNLRDLKIRAKDMKCLLVHTLNLIILKMYNCVQGVERLNS